MDAKALLRHAAQRASPATVKRYEMLRYVKTFVAPVAAADGLQPETVAARLRELSGIDMREDAQVARVEQWTKYTDIFSLLRSDPLINTWYKNEPRLHNSYSPTPDAEAYAAIVADERSGRIVEVGGGFSTLIARRTNDHLGLSCELVVIDPEPRTEVATAADKLVRGRVENVAADLVAGDTATFVNAG